MELERMWQEDLLENNPKKYITCDCCDSEIYEGQDYLAFDMFGINKTLCLECMEGCIKEVYLDEF